MTSSKHTLYNSPAQKFPVASPSHMVSSQTPHHGLKRLDASALPTCLKSCLLLPLWFTQLPLHQPFCCSSPTLSVLLHATPCLECSFLKPSRGVFIGLSPSVTFVYPSAPLHHSIPSLCSIFSEPLVSRNRMIS